MISPSQQIRLIRSHIQLARDLQEGRDQEDATKAALSRASRRTLTRNSSGSSRLTGSIVRDQPAAPKTTDRRENYSSGRGWSNVGAVYRAIWNPNQRVVANIENPVLDWTTEAVANNPLKAALIAPAAQLALPLVSGAGAATAATGGTVAAKAGAAWAGLKAASIPAAVGAAAGFIGGSLIGGGKNPANAPQDQYLDVAPALDQGSATDQGIGDTYQIQNTDNQYIDSSTTTTNIIDSPNASVDNQRGFSSYPSLIGPSQTSGSAQSAGQDTNADQGATQDATSGINPLLLAAVVLGGAVILRR